MSTLMKTLGLQSQGTDTVLFVLGMACFLFMIVAWLTDELMERLSFGIIINTILLLSGAVLGLLALSWFGMSPTRQNYLFALFFCFVTAIVALLIPAAFKRAV